MPPIFLKTHWWTNESSSLWCRGAETKSAVTGMSIRLTGGQAPEPDELVWCAEAGRDGNGGGELQQ
jgi:hypothetical protein